MTQAMDEAGQQEGLKDQATAKVQDAASVAQEKASELREQGSARLRGQFDQRSSQAGSQVRSLADALRRSGDDLRNEGNTSGAQVAAQAADRIERVGGYLEQKSGDELMRDIETFARRRPWLLAGLGMLAGVAAARFMKASSDERYAEYRPVSGQRPGGPSTSGTRGGLSGPGELEGGGYVASDVPTTSSEDALARDPYAGRR